MKNQPKFEIGQLVHHKRYDYRGVVFAYDEECTADDGWYQNNQTQPKRDQPWYHVLVHMGQHTTYVAESNLEPDVSAEQIVHPLVGRFFKSFLDGKYSTESLN